MRRTSLIAILILLCSSVLARNERDTLGVGGAVAFVENRGQWAGPYHLEAQLHDAALFFEEDCMTVALGEGQNHPDPTAHPRRYHAYRMRFAGCKPVVPEGLFQQRSTNNYYLGNDATRWRSGVPAYDAVRYEGLYDGVDLEVFGSAGVVKYNFIVRAGADPRQMALMYEGTEGVSVSSGGTLLIRTTVRDIVEMRPYVYQRDDDGTEKEVASRWRVSREKGGYRAYVEVGQYDTRRELVIDPVLIFSTYTGSTADNWGTTAAYDSKKNVYTAGLVFNIGYPVTTGAYQPTFAGGCDIGIFKFDSTGSQRIYATYLGGYSSDMPHSMYVNTYDELLIFGTTGSNDFPTTAGTYRTTHSGGPSINYLNPNINYSDGSDIFVCRFSADGNQLQASTLIGGSGNDGLNYRESYNANYTVIMQGNDSLYFNYGDGARGEIITDNLNNVYIGSTTFSTDFPVTAGCVQPAIGGRQDGIVFKLDYNLRNLLWSTYLGGTKDDAVYSIDVDTSYNLLVCGGTNSSDFPVTDGVYQTTYGGGTADGFVSKISYGGERLMASSYMGQRFYDQLYFVRSGHHNEIFLFGQSRNSGNAFIYNAGYGTPNAGMLLARMAPDMTTLRWSTVFGTPGRINLSPTAFSSDICNRIYAAGWGRDFVGYNNVTWNTAGTAGMETTPDAYNSTTDGQDFYILSLDADGNNLQYATFFGELHGESSAGGGDHVDGGTSRFDRLATLYQSVCASCGGTQGFPTTASAWSDSNRAANCNNGLFRFNVTDDFPVAEFVPPPVGCAPYTVQFHNTGRGTSFLWDFGDGTTSTEREPSHTYTDGGIYTITLIASQPSGCSTTDTIHRTLHVIGGTPLPTIHNIACNGGSIQIGPTPQIGATYQWLSDNVSDPTIANPWVSTAGTYLLRVNATGCSEVDTFKVQTYTLVSHWQALPVSCHDSTDGGARFHINNGIDIDSLTFNVTPAAIHYLEAPRTYRLDSLTPGTTYHISVSGYGCLYEQDITLQNPATPHYEKDFTAALCSDSCTGSIYIQYNLSDIPEIQPLDTLISNLCAGTYITRLTSIGCPIVDTTVIIRNHNIDSLRLWADRTHLYLGESTNLHATVHSPTSVSYSWSPAADLNRPDIPDPVATPTDTLTVYRVTVSDGTCTASDTLSIHCADFVCGAPEFSIPNAFTPNNDGINDRLCFHADILAEFSIAIFNRWGQCVYESTDASQCWDGTFRNAPCLAGVYTYTCHIRCHNNIETDFKGDITLIR